MPPRRARLAHAVRDRLPQLDRRRTTLIVPVPAAEAPLERFRPPGVLPPHITVLFPFAPVRALDASFRDALAQAIADFAPFSFRLPRIGRFPGVMYLEPEPVEPFVKMTDAVRSRWPEYQPYEGRFQEVIPHLTVLEGAEPDVSGLERALPIQSTARVVWLMAPGPGERWSRMAELPLRRAP